MMRRTIPVMLLGALLGLPLTAGAQSTIAYRGQVTADAAGTIVNQTSPLVTPGAHGWMDDSLFAAAGAGSWEPTSRFRLAGGITLTGSRDNGIRVDLREVYGRLSATDWMDVEAGKRLLRWGVGYGFSPAGVLDPPRVATDPTDRLGVSAGREMARVDLFRGQTSLTVAAAGPSRLTAVRLRTMLSGGVDVAVIASAAPGAGPSWGGTVTDVVGQQFEWHAEVIQQDARRSRAMSAVAGGQYTFLNGLNVVLEYHRDGRNPDGRRQSLFLRAARTATDTGLAPELILIAGLDDGSRTVVPGITWTPRGRVEWHARAIRLLGARRSIARLAPWSTALTLGATIRF